MKLSTPFILTLTSAPLAISLAISLPEAVQTTKLTCFVVTLSSVEHVPTSTKSYTRSFESSRSGESSSFKRSTISSHRLETSTESPTHISMVHSPVYIPPQSTGSSHGSETSTIMPTHVSTVHSPAYTPPHSTVSSHDSGTFTQRSTHVSSVYLPSLSNDLVHLASVPANSPTSSKYSTTHSPTSPVHLTSSSTLRPLQSSVNTLSSSHASSQGLVSPVSSRPMLTSSARSSSITSTKSLLHGSSTFSTLTTKTTSSKSTTATNLGSSSASKSSSRSVLSSSSRSAPTPSDYPSTGLYYHNKHRSNHSVPALTWNVEQALIAAEIASSCVFAHNMTVNGGGYGQNIAAYGSTADISSMDPSRMLATSIVNQWYYSEVDSFLPSYYGQPTPDFTNFHVWGHFSQIVWAATGSVGCASQFCPDNTIFNGYDSWYTVCNYAPPGNVLTLFGDNVFPPIGQPAITFTV